jgi:hypothetical protein
MNLSEKEKQEIIELIRPGKNCINSYSLKNYHLSQFINL